MARMNEQGGVLAALREDRALRAVLLLCLTLRLLYSFAVFPIIGERLMWKGVDDKYDEIARNLLQGEGYVIRAGDAPNLITPPGYVYFLALLYRLTGAEVNEGVRVRILQPLLDTATCFLVFLLGALVFRRRGLAILAALGWALYPQAIVYTARVAPESLFILLLTGMMYTLARYRAAGRTADLVLCGLLWAAAALVKEKVILLPPLLILLALPGMGAGLRRRGARTLLLLLAMAAPLTPWLARQYAVTGMIVPITMRSGRALNQGMNESFAGADRWVEELPDRLKENERRERERAEAALGEEERLERARAGARDERGLIGKALARIAGDPGAFARAFLVKSAAFWYYGQPRVIWGNVAIQIPLLLLAIGGYVRGWRRYDLKPFLAVTVYFVVVHALTIVRMRYSLPIMPETMLVAVSLVLSLRGGREGPEATAPRRG
ncbi:MAG: glycosyltransferase family 39 protein [Candidatus Eisenbacteria bacterium]|nr:glycosyltransferase family 39 protein [Candidatus Eisenbacteria bacterium]